MKGGRWNGLSLRTGYSVQHHALLDVCHSQNSCAALLSGAQMDQAAVDYPLLISKCIHSHTLKCTSSGHNLAQKSIEQQTCNWLLILVSSVGGVRDHLLPCVTRHSWRPLSAHVTTVGMPVHLWTSTLRMSPSTTAPSVWRWYVTFSSLIAEMKSNFSDEDQCHIIFSENITPSSTEQNTNHFWLN